MRTSHLYGNIFLLFLTFQLFTGISQASAQKVDKRKSAVVYIVVEDTTILKDLTVDFSLNKDGINSSYSFDTDTYDIKLTAKETKNIIPLYSAINYGRISFFSLRESLKMSLNSENNLFIFQPGDTIVLHLSDQKGIFFTGKHSPKYNCMYEISNSDELHSVAKYNAYKEAKDFEGAYNYRRFQLDSIYNLQMHILNRFERELDPIVYELIKVDCRAKLNQHMVDLLHTPFEFQKVEEYASAKAVFFKHYGNYNDTLLKDTTLLLRSYYYVDFLVRKEKIYATLVNSTDDKSYYPELRFGDINAAIDLHYRNGATKDKIKLLAFYSIDRRRQGDFSKYINEAIQYSNDNVYGQALKDFKNSNSDQADAFPFDLQDQIGDSHKLSDFKGKVVVMDFWFTGCGGCLAMAKTLKPIVAAYKSNPKIVFITICIDIDRETWLKSLMEEKYGSPDEVNLFAGMGRASLIVKHYNLSMFPTLVIISPTGKLLSTAPPDPRLDKGKFIDYLDKNIQ